MVGTAGGEVHLKVILEARESAFDDQSVDLHVHEERIGEVMRTNNYMRRE